jgi:hypothetical protein
MTDNLNCSIHRFGLIEDFFIKQRKVWKKKKKSFWSSLLNEEGEYVNSKDLTLEIKLKNENLYFDFRKDTLEENIEEVNNFIRLFNTSNGNDFLLIKKDDKGNTFLNKVSSIDEIKLEECKQ